MYDSKSISQTQQFNNLVDLLDNRALSLPLKTGHIFLDDGEIEKERMTFRQLQKRAIKIAAHLQSQTKPGDRAMLIYQPGLDFIAAFFGCLYAGVIAVPVYPPDLFRLDETFQRLKVIFKDANPTCVLTEAAILPFIEEGLKNNPEFCALQFIATDSLNTPSKQWRKPEISGKAIAFLQYTSGSTGMPKGVMVTHRNLLHNFEIMSEWYNINPEVDKGVSWLPPYHDMGLIGSILYPIHAKTEVVLMSPLSFLQKPVRWLNAISNYGCTITGGPNFAFDLCTRRTTDADKKKLDLSHLKVLINGAEPIRPHVMEKFATAFRSCGFRKEMFSPAYGMAENTLLASSVNITDQWHTVTLSTKALAKNIVSEANPYEKCRQIVCCGNIRPSQDIKIVDPETLQKSPPNQIGEIWISGSSKATGYWRQSKLSQKTFECNLLGIKNKTFLRTGDLGFIRENKIYFTGRLKDIIIISVATHKK